MATKSKEGKIALFHLSPNRNRGSIMDGGLLISKAKSKRKGVWLFDDKMFRWAVKHIALHQGVDRKQLDLYSVYVRKSDLSTIRTGIYLCKIDIPLEDVFFLV